MNISNLCYSFFFWQLWKWRHIFGYSKYGFDLMQEYFIKYLNRHKDEIMEGVADLMINDAKSGQEDAIKEIDEYKKSLLKLLEE